MEVAELDNLIQRAQRQDAAAFDVLIERYAPRLYGYFYRATGRRVDAEDLLQDLFVRLVSTIGHYRHDGRFEPWLFRIATNLVRDRIRRTRTSRETHFAGGEPDEADGWDSYHDGLQPASVDRLTRAEELDRLQWALDQLPEPERMVVLLRHFSQMSFKDVAELMGTPLGTALARAHRGLARLRELMACAGERDEERGAREREHGREELLP